MGSTPYASRSLSTTATITSVGGRAPPERKKPRPAKDLIRAPQLKVFSLQALESRSRRWSRRPRRPVSTSVRRTHSRSVSAVQPILAAIQLMAATQSRNHSGARTPSRPLARVPLGNTSLIVP